MTRLACLLLPLLVLSGCVVSEVPADADSDTSSDELSESGKKSKKKSKPAETDAEEQDTSDTRDPPETPAVEEPAAPSGPDATYSGTLAETEARGFAGVTPDGLQVCAIQQWQSITVDVTVDAKGDVKSLTFKGTNVEQANPACAGVTVAGTSQHTYTFTNAAPKDEPSRLVAAPGNVPRVELIADVAARLDTGRVTFDFRAGTPNGWRYTLQIPLTKI